MVIGVIRILCFEQIILRRLRDERSLDNYYFGVSLIAEERQSTTFVVHVSFVFTWYITYHK